MNKSRRAVPLLFALVAAGLLFASLKQPLWRMRMESPQYRDTEALRVEVYPGALRGDLREIGIIDKYIGVSIPKELPQLRWLPVILMIAAVLGVVAAALPFVVRRPALVTIAVLVALSLLGSAAMAQRQMYRIGHERNHHTVLRGVKDFTPPLLGHVKIENFEVSSWLGMGAYMIGVAIMMQVLAAMPGRRCSRTTAHGEVKGACPAHAHKPSESLA